MMCKMVIWGWGEEFQGCLITVNFDETKSIIIITAKIHTILFDLSTLYFFQENILVGNVMSIVLHIT